MRLWVPSQNGLVTDPPQRHKENAGLPVRSYFWPSASTNSIEPSDHFRQAGCVIRAEVKSRVAPDFAKWGNVVGDNRAAGESRFEGRHAEWLVARSSRIDSCMAVQRAKLRLGLWAF